MFVANIREDELNEIRDLLISQDEIIKTQQELIKTLKESIEKTEKSRDYWINRYYDLSEEMLEKENPLSQMYDLLYGNE